MKSLLKKLERDHKRQIQFAIDFIAKNKNKNMKIKKTKTNKKAILFLTIISLPVAIFLLTAYYLPETDHLAYIATVDYKAPRRLREANYKPNFPVELYKRDPKMALAIYYASLEFNVPVGLMLGIANAESTMGTKFHNEYDRDNCYNWWGLKGGNEKLRKDSSLRCFTLGKEEGGARTMAKTLRLYYLDEGKDTPEKIVKKWVGPKWSQYHNTWINNVNKYF